MASCEISKSKYLLAVPVNWDKLIYISESSEFVIVAVIVFVWDSSNSEFSAEIVIIFASVTLIVTVAFSLSTSPSFTLKSKLSLEGFSEFIT